jgi:hypothetical protein
MCIYLSDKQTNKGGALEVLHLLPMSFSNGEPQQIADLQGSPLHH